MRGMDPFKPWLIVEVIHPELRPTRFARRTDAPDIDAMLFTAGIATAAHDKSLPYPARYPLIVFSWRAEAYDAPRPEVTGLPGPTPGLKKTRARLPTYAESRDRATAIRKATSWGRLPRGALAACPCWSRSARRVASEISSSADAMRGASAREPLRRQIA
jgi:hypothetical protein